METGYPSGLPIGPGNGALTQAPTRPTTIYEDHQGAVIEFHEACHDLQRAAARREVASKRLRDITERLAGQMQGALNDPTQTKDPEAMPMQQRGFIGH